MFICFGKIQSLVTLARAVLTECRNDKGRIKTIVDWGVTVQEGGYRHCSLSFQEVGL